METVWDGWSWWRWRFESDVSDFLVSGALFAFFVAEATWSRAGTGAVQELM